MGTFNTLHSDLVLGPLVSSHEKSSYFGMYGTIATLVAPETCLCFLPGFQSILLKVPGPPLGELSA